MLKSEVPLRAAGLYIHVTWTLLLGFQKHYYEKQSLCDDRNHF